MTTRRPGPAPGLTDYSRCGGLSMRRSSTWSLSPRRPINARLVKIASRVVRGIRRDRLDRNLRPIFDDVLIDALSETGDWEEIQARLARIPAAECGPRVWQALEAATTARLAQAALDREPVRSFNRALEVWDSSIRLAWPAGSEFPRQLTQRVGGLAQSDASKRLGLWLDRLRLTGDELAAMTRTIPRVAVIAAERTRVESQLSRSP